MSWTGYPNCCLQPFADDGSLAPPFLTPEVEKFLVDLTAMKEVADSSAVSASMTGYDAIYLPGGEFLRCLAANSMQSLCFDWICLGSCLMVSQTLNAIRDHDLVTSGQPAIRAQFQ